MTTPPTYRSSRSPAFAMKGDEERIRDGGCQAYLAKPISVATFLETIRRLLE